MIPYFALLSRFIILALFVILNAVKNLKANQQESFTKQVQNDNEPLLCPSEQVYHSGFICHSERSEESKGKSTRILHKTSSE